MRKRKLIHHDEQFNEKAIWRGQIGITFSDVSGMIKVKRQEEKGERMKE